VAINGVLREILELLRHQPSYRQINVITHLKEDFPPVLRDPSGLRLICMNLLINGHQAITNGGTVEVTTDRADDDMVSIQLRDTGCGIPHETIEQIWDPLFTTKEEGKGIGLSLALTYNIVHA